MKGDAVPFGADATRGGAVDAGTADGRAESLAKGGVASRSFTSLALALLLAVIAQGYLWQRQYPLDGVVFFLLAALVFWRALERGDLPQEAPPVVPREEVSIAKALARRRPHLVEIGLALAALAFVGSGGNTFRPLSVAAWTAAVIVLLVGLWDGDPGRALRSRAASWRDGLSLPWPRFGIVAVMLIAAFACYYRLDRVPLEMTSDHAEKLLDVHDVLSGQRPIFFPRNTGREPLQFYAAALVASFRGLDYLDLKLVTATAGFLTVPVVYLLGKELFHRRVGLIAAALVAVSPWHVGISRVGLRFPLATLFSALALLFFLRGLRTGRRNDFLLAGLVVGVGLYGYSPFRVVPLFLVACLLVALAAAGARPYVRRALLVNAGLGALVAMVVFVPLGRFLLERPDLFWQRAASRLVGRQQDSPLATFADNVLREALAFNWKGDPVWVNGVPYDPFLGKVVGAFFVLGLVYAAFAVTRRRTAPYGYLLLGIPLLTLSSTLSLAFPQENPSLVRSAPAIPVVFLVAALPLALAWQRLEALVPDRAGRVAGAAMLAALVVYLGVLGYQRYFVDYDLEHRRSSWNSSEVAAVMKGFVQSVGDLEHAYLKSWPHWVDHRNVGIQMGNPAWNNVVMSDEAFAQHRADPAPKLYVLNVNDRQGLARLQAVFPEGTWRVQRGHTPGKEFVVFFVPGHPGGSAQQLR